MEDTTPHNIQKSTIVLAVAVVALAVVAVWQQQQISQIRSGQAGVVSNTRAVSQNQPVLTQAQATRQSLLATRIISGTVVSSNASEVVIKTNLVNLTALDKFDFKTSQPLPAITKNLTINLVKDTVSDSKLAVGEIVTIKTNEPVYGSGTLTAVSVNIFVPPKTTASPPKP